MWCWQLVSFWHVDNTEVLEQDGWEISMEDCFRNIQNNTWRLDDASGMAYIYLDRDRSHPFKFNLKTPE